MTRPTWTTVASQSEIEALLASAENYQFLRQTTNWVAGLDTPEKWDEALRVAKLAVPKEPLYPTPKH